MRNITHFVAHRIFASCAVTVIEILSRLESIKHITVCLYQDKDADMRTFARHIAAAKAKARQLRSARLRIDIIVK
jgi:hypothetical protein